MKQALHIGEFANAVGTTSKTVRFYEEEGILPPARRSEQGWRLYDSTDIDRLRFVRGARSIGLSLDEIRRFLSHRDRGEPACNDVLESIEKQIAEVDRQIEELSRLREDLERLHADGLARPMDRNDMLGCVCELVGTRAS